MSLTNIPMRAQAPPGWRWEGGWAAVTDWSYAEDWSGGEWAAEPGPKSWLRRR